MRSCLGFLSLVLGLLTLATPTSSRATEDFSKQPKKEWTALVFLNGHSKLSLNGAYDVNEMEQIGSTDKINIVTQWASRRYGVNRLFITHDENMNVVNSPFLSMPVVDMGDWNRFVEFIEWGVSHFPAEKYFIEIWGHGTGWRNGLSSDDNTGNSISLEQLRIALAKSAKVIGHKIDIFSADACLMGMVEVAEEISESARVYIGSEQTEPGDGWPYDQILERWSRLENSKPTEVAKIVVEEFGRFYSHGFKQATLAAYDLSEMKGLNRALSKLSQNIVKLDEDQRRKLNVIASDSAAFFDHDYKDLGDFIRRVEASGEVLFDRKTLRSAQEALRSFIIANSTTSDFSDAAGVAIWLPTRSRDFSDFQEQYRKLMFSDQTQWADALSAMTEAF